ncbi:hypothetical protein Nepgr_005888 [Nepenthes gracilis]|uniref:Alpha/beta hydrolase fold-3 domain-containing protein n=1 Tax=Nepenthes gracilis TaxID=150966 RepID=A0AAD3XGT6_NEPGR|nr:hypothetical protein Nepgr_005888 [Nepenthes gracilis]
MRTKSSSSQKPFAVTHPLPVTLFLMDNLTKSEVEHELLPYIRVYKDGRVERLMDEDFEPPTADPKTGVSSKDVTIDPQAPLSARLYLPKSLSNTTTTTTRTTAKVPLLIYFHGGSFIISTPFNSKYHNHLNTLVSEANVVAVSVHYRRAPEYLLPIAYDDSRAALQWIASHRGAAGPDDWLNHHADFERVVIAGDSAGANIAHNLVLAAGDDESGLHMSLSGLALVHPFFWGSRPTGMETAEPRAKAFVDQIWPSVCPSSMPVPGWDDPRINPVANGAPSLSGLGCGRVLVCVAQKDVLRDRGWLYYEALRTSGWPGTVEFEETEGETHVFHLHDQGCERAKKLVKTLADFFNKIS